MYNLEDFLIHGDKDLYNIGEIPDWYKDNDYIQNRYRKWGQTWTYYLKTLFRVHNETFNIWSHLIGSILFIVLSVYTNQYLVLKPLGDIVAIHIFLVSVTCCFILSAIMHTFYPMSKQLCKQLLKLDYIGISVLILGSYGPFIYYAFYCNSTLQWIYYIFLNMCGLMTIITSCYNTFQQPKYRCYRAGIFILFVCSVFIPIIHRIVINPLTNDGFLIELEYYILASLFYLLGVFFFIYRTPERHITNCNVCCISHQLFHIWTIVGACITYYGIIKTHQQTQYIQC